MDDANVNEAEMTQENLSVWLDSDIRAQQDLKRFFLVVLAGILAFCYGVGAFYSGRATAPEPEIPKPQVYVVHDSQATTTVPLP
jgi:hypothetical protein